MKKSMNALTKEILKRDTVRVFLKYLGVHNFLELYFRSFPRKRKFGEMLYVVDSLEGWLVEKEIFHEAIYDNVFDMRDVKNFCDLGCNRGFFSLWAASRIGNKARGLLIEANPHLVGQVSDLLRANQLSECKVFSGAVGAGSERDGTVQFLIPPTDVGAGLKEVASIVLSNDQCEVQSVPILNVGRLWNETLSAGTRCNLLKVDIEGAEWRFLREEKEFLTLVDKMVVEIHTKMGDENELLEIIKMAGFIELSRRVVGDGVYLFFAERQKC